MNRHNKIVLFLIVASLLIANSIFVGNGFAQEDRSAEVDKYMEMIRSPRIAQRIQAAKKITGSGLTDPRLFDLIKEELLKRLDSKQSSEKIIDEMSWFCKALASSGDEEYKETLKNIADRTGSEKLKRYALQSLSLVDDYSKKNKIMADTKYADEEMSAETARYISMLKSDDISLKKDAAKKIIRKGLYDEKLMDTVNDELLKIYSPDLSSADRYKIDAAAWLCKTLGASGMTNYRETLKKIVDTTQSENLKKHCLKGLDMLDQSR